MKPKHPHEWKYTSTNIVKLNLRNKTDRYHLNQNSPNLGPELRTSSKLKMVKCINHFQGPEAIFYLISSSISKKTAKMHRIEAEQTTCTRYTRTREVGTSVVVGTARRGSASSRPPPPHPARLATSPQLRHTRCYYQTMSLFSPY